MRSRPASLAVICAVCAGSTVVHAQTSAPPLTPAPAVPSPAAPAAAPTPASVAPPATPPAAAGQGVEFSALKLMRDKGITQYVDGVHAINHRGQLSGFFIF